MTFDTNPADDIEPDREEYEAWEKQQQPDYRPVSEPRETTMLTPHDLIRIARELEAAPEQLDHKDSHEAVLAAFRMTLAGPPHSVSPQLLRKGQPYAD